MAAKLVIAPEAEQDINEAYDWYENQRPGLGEEFLNCVEASIQRTLRSPELPTKVHLDYRRVMLRRFPYIIYYEYLLQQKIPGISY